MKFTAIIPARFASTRLPGKPLLMLGGRPLIYWAWKSACESDASDVYVATDHADIAKAVESFGGQVVMTRENHPSGTDRLAEAAEKLGLGDDDVVVNLQGDEPRVAPQVINQVAELLNSAPEASMATLSEPIEKLDDYLNPNVVKVVAAQTGRALYFSRASLPVFRDESPELSGGIQRHLGLYAYRVGLLHRFVQWPESALEKAEKLEQLRVLEAGEGIWINQACAPSSPGIDTPEQLAELNANWKVQ